MTVSTERREAGLVSPPAPRRGLRRHRRFLYGFLTGIGAVVLLVKLVNAFDAVDVFVRPLLIPDSTDDAQAIVVPGAGVIGPQCALNLSAMRRTILASRLYREGRAPLVVFSGGKPRHSPCTVAEAMATFAETLGVPHDAILIESNAATTRENAVLTAEILKPRGIDRVLLVTDALHAVRSRAAFQKVGLAAGTASVPVVQVSRSNVDMLRVAAHEYLGLLYYRLRGFG